MPPLPQIREQMSVPEMENQFWAVGCGLGWTVGKGSGPTFEAVFWKHHSVRTEKLHWKKVKTSPKGFSASKCDVGNWMFSKLGTFWEIFCKFFGFFQDFRFFFRIFLGIFFGGIFREDLFGRIFLGGFLGGFFGEEFFACIVKVS